MFNLEGSQPTDLHSVNNNFENQTPFEVDHEDFTFIEENTLDSFGLKPIHYDKLAIQNSNYSYILGVVYEFEEVIKLVSEFINSDFSNVNLIEQVREQAEKLSSKITDQNEKDNLLALAFLKDDLNYIFTYSSEILNSSEYKSKDGQENPYKDFCVGLKDFFDSRKESIKNHLDELINKIERKNSFWNFFV